MITNLFMQHTVAQYSLSTLLMFILSHYLSQHDAFIDTNYPSIHFKMCQKAYTDSKFGPKPTQSIDIMSDQQKIKNQKTYKMVFLARR